MDSKENMVCVILAAGKGKRMAATELPKVCMPVAGRPAILRAMDSYKAAGIRNFLLVVGMLADKVMATVSVDFPEALYVYQAELRGTGHAARAAVEALAAQGYAGPVLIVMGDKVVRPGVVRRLMEHYRKSRPTMLISVLPMAAESSAGRVLQDAQGRVLGIVEVADVRRAREGGTLLKVGRAQFSAAEVEEQSIGVNASNYLVEFDALRQALAKLRPNNAQGEFYLTDTVESLAADGRVEAMMVADPTDMMTFNTPAELQAIESVLRREQAAVGST
jgi:bifunctional UDP-N-acetylglucosamine pyrophosphorylase / glucosamine-1-phosphate N-acetyltransferase